MDLCGGGGGTAGVISNASRVDFWDPGLPELSKYVELASFLFF